MISMILPGYGQYTLAPFFYLLPSTFYQLPSTIYQLPSSPVDIVLGDKQINVSRNSSVQLRERGWQHECVANWLLQSSISQVGDCRFDPSVPDSPKPQHSHNLAIQVLNEEVNPRVTCNQKVKRSVA